MRKAAVPLFRPTRSFEIADTNQRSELTLLFTDQLTARLPLLAIAIAAAQPEEAYQIAHGVEGSAAIVGAPRVKEICHAICELTRHGSTEGAAELHSQLVDAAAHTSAAMLAYQERRDGRPVGHLAHSSRGVAADVGAAKPADVGGADSNHPPTRFRARRANPKSR